MKLFFNDFSRSCGDIEVDSIGFREARAGWQTLCIKSERQFSRSHQNDPFVNPHHLLDIDSLEGGVGIESRIDFPCNTVMVVKEREYPPEVSKDGDNTSR
jgi:hypothetical protein